VVTALALALILGIGFLYIFRLLARPIALFILSISLAASLAPVVSWLGKRMPRTLAVVLVYLVLILILVGIGWIITPPLVNQAGQFADRVPNLVDRAEEWLAQFNLPTENIPILDTIASQLGGLGSQLVALPLAISSSLFDIFVVIFLSIYILLMAPQMEDFYLSLFPMSRRRRAGHVANRMVDAMGGYLRGVVISAAILGVMTYIALLILGVNFPVVLGLITGLFEIIPVVGPIIAGAIIVAVALLESLTKGLIALVLVILLQQFEGNILVPNVMRSQAHVSPLLALLAIFAGAAIGGLLGALIAIPIAAALRVFTIEVIAPAIRRQTGAPQEEEDREHE
jgi:predicted PurR-regulated permease PerM